MLLRILFVHMHFPFSGDAIYTVEKELLNTIYMNIQSGNELDPLVCDLKENAVYYLKESDKPRFN